MDRTGNYFVEREGAERGCLVDPWVVTFSAGVAAIVAGTAAVRAIDCFGNFLANSIRNCIDNQPPDIPYFERQEPFFERLDGGNAPTFDLDYEKRDQQELLKRTATLALNTASRPLGRTASRITVICGDGPHPVIDEDALRQLKGTKEFYQNGIVTYLRNRRCWRLSHDATC